MRNWDWVDLLLIAAIAPFVILALVGMWAFFLARDRADSRVERPSECCCGWSWPYLPIGSAHYRG